MPELPLFKFVNILPYNQAVYVYVVDTNPVDVVFEGTASELGELLTAKEYDYIAAADVSVVYTAEAIGVLAIGISYLVLV